MKTKHEIKNNKITNIRLVYSLAAELFIAESFIYRSKNQTITNFLSEVKLEIELLEYEENYLLN